MLAIVEAIAGITKALIAVLDLIFFFYETGAGLRWLLSPAFRRQMRQPGNERKKREYVAAAIFTCFMLALGLVMIVLLLRQA